MAVRTKSKIDHRSTGPENRPYVAELIVGEILCLDPKTNTSGFASNPAKLLVRVKLAEQHPVWSVVVSLVCSGSFESLVVTAIDAVGSKWTLQIHVISPDE